MLDNTDNQRLHERIAEVATFLPGQAAPPACSPEASLAESVPFSRNKIERIVDRVYERLANEADEIVDPCLRELLAHTLQHPDAAPHYSERKLQRILACVQRRLEADRETSLPAEPAPRPPRKISALAGLRSVAAALLLRHLSFEARLLSDPRASRPLTDGPTD